jgi:hypothetical protein
MPAFQLDLVEIRTLETCFLRSGRRKERKREVTQKADPIY